MCTSIAAPTLERAHGRSCTPHRLSHARTRPPPLRPHPLHPLRRSCSRTHPPPPHAVHPLRPPPTSALVRQGWQCATTGAGCDNEGQGASRFGMPILAMCCHLRQSKYHMICFHMPFCRSSNSAHCLSHVFWLFLHNH